MNINIDETISQVERLYERVTGESIPNGDLHYPPMNADVDPTILLNVRVQNLLSALSQPTTVQMIQPWTPPMSVWENDEKILVRVELAGVHKEDIDISVRGNMLVINGKRKNIPREAGFHPRWVEHPSGCFQRIVALPFEGVSTEINSQLKDGILEINLPKKTMSAPRSGKKTKTQAQ